MPYEEGIEGIFLTKFNFSSFQIFFNPIHRQVGQIDGSNLASFSANTEFTGIQIDSGFI